VVVPNYLHVPNNPNGFLFLLKLPVCSQCRLGSIREDNQKQATRSPPRNPTTIL
jgi:hypothetical protein